MCLYKETSLFLSVFLKVLELLFTCEVEFNFVFHQQLLISLLLIFLLLLVSIILGLFLGLFLSLADVLLLLCILELLKLLLSPVNHVGALKNLTLPKVLDGVELLVLGVLQVRGHLIEEERAIGLIAISHVLLAILVLEVLEFEVGNCRSGKVESEGGLV